MRDQDCDEYRALAAELAELYDRLLAGNPSAVDERRFPLANVLGYLRRVPEQRYYREPPRGAGGMRRADSPPLPDLRLHVVGCRAEVRRRGI